MRNLSQRLILARNGYKQRVQNKIRDATDFTKFTTCSVMLLVLSAMLFCVLIFKTNTIYSFRDLEFFSGDRLAKLVKHNTSVESIQNWVMSNNVLGNIPGISGSMTVAGLGTGKSQFPDYDVYTYPQEVYEVLSSGPLWEQLKLPDSLGGANRTLSSNKAKALAAVFDYCNRNSNIGYNLGIGIMASIIREGDPCMKQSGYTVAGWPGGDYITTAAHIQAVRNAGNNSKNTTGFGICQWTWHTYLPVYADSLTKYLQTSGTLSEDDMRAADLDYLFRVVIPSQLGSIDVSSPGRSGYSWAAVYERAKSSVEPSHRQRIAILLDSYLKKYL